MTSSDKRSVICRDIKDISEMRAVEELQIQAWGDDPRDIVPLSQLVAAHHGVVSAVGDIDPVLAGRTRATAGSPGERRSAVRRPRDMLSRTHRVRHRPCDSYLGRAADRDRRALCRSDGQGIRRGRGPCCRSSQNKVPLLLPQGIRFPALEILLCKILSTALAPYRDDLSAIGETPYCF